MIPFIPRPYMPQWYLISPPLLPVIVTTLVCGTGETASVPPAPLLILIGSASIASPGPVTTVWLASRKSKVTCVPDGTDNSLLPSGLTNLKPLTVTVTIVISDRPHDRPHDHHY